MVRSYKQYVPFQGSVEELNKMLFDMQTEQTEIVSVHKLYDNNYEVLVHMNIGTPKLEVNLDAIQDNQESSSED